MGSEAFDVRQELHATRRQYAHEYLGRKRTLNFDTQQEQRDDVSRGVEDDAIATEASDQTRRWRGWEFRGLSWIPMEMPEE